MPDAPLPVRPIALDDERQLRDSLFYPYDCMASVRAHDACMSEVQDWRKDWRKCDKTRDAMDACVEAGERRRFVLDKHCSRAKRIYQTCLLEYVPEGTDEVACSSKLASLRHCVDGANREASLRGAAVPAPGRAS